MLDALEFRDKIGQGAVLAGMVLMMTTAGMVVAAALLDKLARHGVLGMASLPTLLLVATGCIDLA